MLTFCHRTRKLASVNAPYEPTIDGYFADGIMTECFDACSIDLTRKIVIEAYRSSLFRDPETFALSRQNFVRFYFRDRPDEKVTVTIDDNAEMTNIPVEQIRELLDWEYRWSISITDEEIAAFVKEVIDYADLIRMAVDGDRARAQAPQPE